MPDIILDQTLSTLFAPCVEPIIEISSENFKKRNPDFSRRLSIVYFRLHEHYAAMLLVRGSETCRGYLFDSLNGKEYLDTISGCKEFIDRYRIATIDRVSVKYPQTNNLDCGFYVVKYIASIYEKLEIWSELSVAEIYDGLVKILSEKFEDPRVWFFQLFHSRSSMRFQRFYEKSRENQLKTGSRYEMILFNIEPYPNHQKRIKLDSFADPKIGENNNNLPLPNPDSGVQTLPSSSKHNKSSSSVVASTSNHASVPSNPPAQPRIINPPVFNSNVNIHPASVVSPVHESGFTMKNRGVVSKLIRHDIENKRMQKFTMMIEFGLDKSSICLCGVCGNEYNVEHADKEEIAAIIVEHNFRNHRPLWPEERKIERTEFKRALADSLNRQYPDFTPHQVRKSAILSMDVANTLITLFDNNFQIQQAGLENVRF